MGDIVHKIKYIKASLSVILGSLLIMPILAFNTPLNNKTFENTNSINSSVNQVGDPDINIHFGSGTYYCSATIHADTIGRLSPGTLPAKGVVWDNTNSIYVSFQAASSGEKFKIYTDSIEYNSMVVIKMVSEDTDHHTASGDALINLHADTKKPTFKTNADGNKVLPKTINANNYSDYITVTDQDKVLLNVTGVTGNNSDGTAVIDGTYRATTYKGSGQIVRSFSYPLKDFAKITNEPTISTNTKSRASEVLPSSVDNINYKNYLNISDQSRIVTVLSFTPYDKTGQLEMEIKYYSTSYHGSGASTNRYTYNLSNFAKSNSYPNFIAKSNIPEILPSKINASNYTNYLNFNGPSSEKGINNFEADDIKGTLDVEVEYFTTSFHGKGAASKTHTYHFLGFATRVTPTMTLNQSNIGKITESDFIKKISNKNVSDTIDALRDYVIIDNVKAQEITTLNYNGGTLKLTYHSTSWKNSSTLIMNQTISGFLGSSGGGGGGGGGPGTTDNTSTIIIATVCTLLILALAGLGTWWYYRNNSISKPRSGGNNPNRNMRLNSNNRNNPPSRNSHVRLAERNPDYGSQRRGRNYPSTYGSQPSSMQPRGQRPMQSRGQPSPMRYPMQIGGQRPPQSRGQYPPQSRGQRPPQSRGQYPPQARGQYPPQSRGQYPPQSRGQYPPQSSRNGSRSNGRPPSRNNGPTNSRNN